MTNNVGSSSAGVGFSSLLTVAFVVLKLTGYITWSWAWVLAPMWIPVLLLLLVEAVVWLVSR